MTTPNLIEAAKAALEAIAEVVRISDRKHDAWDAVKAEIDALRAAIAEAEKADPIKKSAIDFLPHDDCLRFVQRVLESSAPQKDRDDATRMVSDMRRSIYTAPQPPAGWQTEPVAWMTHHDEPMLFPTWLEASRYCEDDEEPIALGVIPKEPT